MATKMASSIILISKTITKILNHIILITQLTHYQRWSTCFPRHPPLLRAARWAVPFRSSSSVPWIYESAWTGCPISPCFPKRWTAHWLLRRSDPKHRPLGSRLSCLEKQEIKVNVILWVILLDKAHTCQTLKDNNDRQATSKIVRGLWYNYIKAKLKYIKRKRKLSLQYMNSRNHNCFWNWKSWLYTIFSIFFFGRQRSLRVID